MTPSKIAIDIATGVLTTFGGTVVLGAIAWLSGPLRWIVHNHQLHKLLGGERKFTLVFNAEADKRKDITFLPNGSIGVGQNINEHTWRVRRGTIEIFAADRKIYSRFRYNRRLGVLAHTNDPELRSNPSQYMRVRLVRVTPPAA